MENCLISSWDDEDIELSECWDDEEVTIPSEEAFPEGFFDDAMMREESYRKEYYTELPNIDYAHLCKSCMGTSESSGLAKVVDDNRECKICRKSFLVVQWNSFGLTRTVICYSCSKLHDVCQLCGLVPDPSYLRHLMVCQDPVQNSRHSNRDPLSRRYVVVYPPERYVGSSRSGYGDLPRPQSDYFA